jgi:uncharacterized iron-regulated membrane protein
VSLTNVASKIHKWLALLIAVQVLIWFVSGLFFAFAPIERVRSEHLIAANRPAALPLDAAAAGLARIHANGVRAAERIELRSMLDRPVALVAKGKERPRLYDLATGRAISPLRRELAVAVAERDQAGDARAVGTALVTEALPEYRGALPAWRVDFEDGERRSVYVAADTGVVTARRSTLWRVYDFLWSLHIMDFKEHDNFNTPLLAIASSVGLAVVLTGFILFPSRLGYTAWRKRRKQRAKTVR